MPVEALPLSLSASLAPSLSLPPSLHLSFSVDMAFRQAAGASPQYVWGDVLPSDCWSPAGPVGREISLRPDLISTGLCQTLIDEWTERGGKGDGREKEMEFNIHSLSIYIVQTATVLL